MNVSNNFKEPFVWPFEEEQLELNSYDLESWTTQEPSSEVSTPMLSSSAVSTPPVSSPILSVSSSNKPDSTTPLSLDYALFLKDANKRNSTFQKEKTIEIPESRLFQLKTELLEAKEKNKSYIVRLQQATRKLNQALTSIESLKTAALSPSISNSALSPSNKSNPVTPLSSNYPSLNEASFADKSHPTSQKEKTIEIPESRLFQLQTELLEAKGKNKNYISELQQKSRKLNDQILLNKNLSDTYLALHESYAESESKLHKFHLKRQADIYQITEYENAITAYLKYIRGLELEVQNLKTEVAVLKEDVLKKKEKRKKGN